MSEKPLSRAAIRPVKERIEDKLLALPGVSAVDINEKFTNGKATGKLSIVVFVDKKKPKSRLSKEELIPEEIEGIPVDVQEEHVELQGLHAAVLEAERQIDATTYRPLRGGVSMGPCRAVFLSPPDVEAPGNYLITGTLGAIVKDRTSGAAMALTNFHVACVDSTWSVGDTMTQPSRVEGGSCPADKFGALTRAVLSEHVDGAVVAIDSGVAHDCAIEQIGNVKGKATASVGMAVRKRGRTTELTHGTVSSTDVSVTIDYGDGLGLRTLKHQIRVAPDSAQNPRFSDNGDSGSVVVDASNRVIGLLFAGTTSGTATFLNPIQNVLDELNVELCVKLVTVITSPIVCGPIITKPVVCLLTKPSTCHIVTRPILCNILTSPRVCQVKTLACPPRTLACPPVSLACGLNPGDLLPGQRAGDGTPDGNEAYGRAGAIDDAFWLGYYSALEALAEAEPEQDGGP